MGGGQEAGSRKGYAVRIQGIVKPEEKIRMGYLQRTLQATLTIMLSVTVVIVTAFGLSERLRLVGVERVDNVLITFVVSLGLVLLAVWLLPRSLVMLKEGSEQGYLHRFLQSLALLWVAVALVLLVSVGLYAVMAAIGVKANPDFLVTFLVSCGLLLLVLSLLPRSLVMLKEEQEERGFN
jgi:magnesium-transporting ATPase (P-type)